MDDLKAFLHHQTFNESVIRSSLLDVDMKMLALALAGLEEADQKIITKHLSYSAKKQLNIRLLSLEGSANVQEIQNAQNILLDTFKKNADQPESALSTEESTQAPIEISTRNKNEIFASLLDISRRSYANGLPSLESTMTHIDESHLENFIIKKGLEYIISGRDLTTAQALLKHLKKCTVQKIEEHLDMIIQGLECIQNGSSNKELVKILESYL